MTSGKHKQFNYNLLGLLLEVLMRSNFASNIGEQYVLSCNVQTDRQYNRYK